MTPRLERRMPAWFLGFLAAIAFCLPARSDTPPNAVLWAWQRPEDLSYVDPAQFAVAYLACTISIGERVASRARVQPLKVSDKARLIPVIRLDIDRRHPPRFSQSQVQTVAETICRFASLPRTAAIQIDYDATFAERSFYRSVLSAVRSQLPSGMPLSITALASWCLFDNWIRDLPVDETVPMMFSLGSERRRVLVHFEQGRDFMQASCCSSLGLSLEDREVDSLMIPLAQRRKIPVRIYFFTRSAWTREKIEKVRSLLWKK